MIFKTNLSVCIYYTMRLLFIFNFTFVSFHFFTRIKMLLSILPQIYFWLVFAFFSMRLMTCSVSFQTETALIYDAVHLFAQALHDLDHSQEINTSPLSCDGSETWQHGNSLVNYMKLVNNDFYIFHI